MLTSIVGINWGDEGKGRMVDLLSQKYDVVVRYQGGNNAGHTVINDKGKFVLNLMPSGILRDETVNVLGPGMVIDTEHMFHEVERLRAGGITITPEHLKISDKAVICMPYHKLLDCLEEDRLADKKFGSTRRGISPAYSDKYMKKALRMGELADRDALKARLTDILEWKNLFVVNGYHHDPIDLDEMMAWIDTYAMPFKDYVCDTTDYLSEAIEDNKSLLFEAQLGALRDIDYGIYPYTSGSSTIAAYAPIGAGIPEARLDSIIGIMKAYSTCVGEGPFTCEMFGDEAAALLMGYADRILKLRHTWTPANLNDFPDGGYVAGWARSAMADAVALGLISGSNDNGVNYLRPQGHAAREQTATILSAFCQNVKKG